MLRYSGILGNTIFFICSAWFLLDSKKSNKHKILQMLLDIWTISVVVLLCVLVLQKGNLSKLTIFYQLLPTSYQNNWYMTCYLVFFIIHPFLNKIIYDSDKKALLRSAIFLSFLYIIGNFAGNFILDYAFFYSSELIVWISIYFIIGYIKLYLPYSSNNFKTNLIFCIIGFLGLYGMILVTNILGLHIGIFQDKLLRWNRGYNPFLILFVIGLFNIVRNITFYNRAINYVSKLSMFIYIIHENYLLRNYYRPYLWKFVYDNFGYSHILAWTFVLVLLVFLFGFIMSILYACTLQKLVKKISNYLYNLLSHIYHSVEVKILQIQ
jgi:hypothetical protein